MASCPTCQKEVNPLRAPSARIVGGRVVTYCSAACTAAAAEAGAAAAKARIAEATRPEPQPAPPSPAASALAAIKQTGRVRDDTPVPARPAKATMPVSAEEILEEREVRARTEPPLPPPPRRKRRGLVLMFMVAIIIGGMAIAIVQAVSPSSPTPAAARAVPDSRAVEVATPLSAPDPAIAAAAAAKAALAELVASESPRVRRIAAAALARTGDPAALDALGALLGDETSEITRLDIAYALARAGDARGKEALAAGLGSSRRDVRADAARLLILLGDPAGAKELGRYLDNRSQRLGAAEALARIEDKEAMEVLDAIYLDATSPPDDKIRATIALGRAHRGAVKDDLVGLLADGRFNAFAAIALAELRDPTGHPILVKQLDVSSLRVGAALALRRLDPELAPAPLLPGLTAAIAGDKDVARVTAAEAILILTGPRAWADRD